MKKKDLLLVCVLFVLVGCSVAGAVYPQIVAIDKVAEGK